MSCNWQNGFLFLLCTQCPDLNTCDAFTLIYCSCHLLKMSIVILIVLNKSQGFVASLSMYLCLFLDYISVVCLCFKPLFLNSSKIQFKEAFPQNNVILSVLVAVGVNCSVLS